MRFKRTQEAVDLWRSINDQTAKELLEDEYFEVMEHRVFPEGIRLAGLGALFGGLNIGFADKLQSADSNGDGGKWFDKKYWVKGKLNGTFTF